MRRIVGFVCFIISSLAIIAIVKVNIRIFNNFFPDLSASNFISVIGIYIAILWELVYQPLVILLLSVIAMGNYSRRK